MADEQEPWAVDLITTEMRKGPPDEGLGIDDLDGILAGSVSEPDLREAVQYMLSEGTLTRDGNVLKLAAPEGRLQVSDRDQRADSEPEPAPDSEPEPPLVPVSRSLGPRTYQQELHVYAEFKADDDDAAREAVNEFLKVSIGHKLTERMKVADVNPGKLRAFDAPREV